MAAFKKSWILTQILVVFGLPQYDQIKKKKPIQLLYI